jgi:hypothetical protein
VNKECDCCGFTPCARPYLLELENVALKAQLTEARELIKEASYKYKKYATHIDVCIYHCGPSVEYDCNCGLEDIENKLDAWLKGDEK